ncbi:MAG TPA: hypothetical protein PKW73_13815, partial [Candidatus Obscuribacter sp.]|nr:hypothetical protein [Candidatus Obscuribacter sp.]
MAFTPEVAIRTSQTPTSDALDRALLDPSKVGFKAGKTSDQGREPQKTENESASVRLIQELQEPGKAQKSSVATNVEGKTAAASEPGPSTETKDQLRLSGLGSLTAEQKFSGMKLVEPGFSTTGADKSKSGGFAHTAIEVGSSLTAGIGGTVAFSLARTAPLPPMAKALTLPVAMLAGGVLKYGSKTALEHAALAPEERTASSADLAWGAVDAVSGIGASTVEKMVATRYFTSLGRAELGATVAAPVAQHAGYMLAKESLSNGIKSNMVRGITGGATGAAIWSLPHRTSENWQEIKQDPYQGLSKTATQLVGDAGLGAFMGGGLGFAGTTIVRYKDVAGKLKAAVMPEKNLLRLDNYHINDFHSNTEIMPRLTTLVGKLQQDSARRGVDARFIVPGDVESGRVNFAFTKGGQIENEVLMRAGAKEFVPGNHAYDAPGGKGDVARYPAVMEPLLQKHPDVSLLAANLDVSAYPQYQRILKPYTVRTVVQDGVEHKVGT